MFKGVPGNVAQIPRVEVETPGPLHLSPSRGGFRVHDGGRCVDVAYSQVVCCRLPNHQAVWGRDGASPPVLYPPPKTDSERLPRSGSGCPRREKRPGFQGNASTARRGLLPTGSRCHCVLLTATTEGRTPPPAPSVSKYEQ